MASIFKRSDNDTWRVVFRRRGIKTYSRTFDTEESAREYALKHEPMFLKDPSRYTEITPLEKLNQWRERERVRKLLKYYNERDYENN